MLWETAVILGIFQIVRSDCPAGCFCTDQSVDCSSKKLTTFPHDQSLQVPQDTIDTLYGLDIKDITCLNLANNQLTEWQGKLLSDVLPNLVSLDLSKNKIAQVANAQSVLLSRKLIYLNLSNNPIQNLGLDLDTILYSQSISHLDVSFCNIKSVTNSESIMYLTNLTHLNLSGNPIFVVDNLHSNTLTYLDLSSCLLGIHGKGIREEAFMNLPKLQHLNISMNAHLTKFSLSEPLSVSVKYLEASDCAFESLDIRYFPYLQRVEMKRNVIKTLHNEILSKNSALESLDISENLINHIEDRALSGGDSLRKLDISQNFIEGFNWNIFSQTPKLEILNISRNFLKSLHEIPLPSLLVLDASRCEIYQLSSKILSKTNNLRYLNLSHNFIEKMPPNLLSAKLMSLDLSYCRLADLKYESYHELSSLRKLNLMGNRLTNPLNHSLLEEVKELNLLDNPWHCDCSDPDFRKAWHYLYMYPKKASSLRHLKCHSPKEHAGMSWEDSCFRVLGEGKKSKTGAWYSFLVPFLTVCCMIAIFVVVRQAYVSHGLEVEQRELSSQRTSNIAGPRGIARRVEAHFFDDDLERGIQMSVNESTQRSPIHDLAKLPSYEEALLLPKLLSEDDLKNIIRNYEERDRFEESTFDATQERCSENNVQSEEPINYPSTSRNSELDESRNTHRANE